MSEQEEKPARASTASFGAVLGVSVLTLLVNLAVLAAIMVAYDQQAEHGLFAAGIYLFVGHLVWEVPVAVLIALAGRGQLILGLAMGVLMTWFAVPAGCFGLLVASAALVNGS